jgi:myosin heavy subunit
MNSSPSPSKRLSFGNILTKITRPSITSRPSVESDGESKQPKVANLPCYACGERTKKNFQCNLCKKIACLGDSGVTSIGNLERTCDDCIHKLISESLSSKDQEKEKISTDIQDLVSKRDEDTKTLNKQSARIRILQTELKESTEKVEQEKKTLALKIQKLQQDSKKMEEEISSLEIENSKRKAIKEHSEKHTKEISKQAEHFKIAVDEMIKERTILLSNLNELRDFIRLQVPVRLIKKIVCSPCFINVQNSFANAFKHVVPIKAEISAKVQPKKSGACASCILF